jgi:hypothetical protein
LMNPTDPKTLDAFRYADNNPVMFTDATGLFSCPAWMPTGVCEAADAAAVASNKAAAASKAAANAASAAAAIAGAASARPSTSSKPAEPSVSEALAAGNDHAPCGLDGYYYPCSMRPTTLNDQMGFDQTYNDLLQNDSGGFWDHVGGGVQWLGWGLNVIRPDNAIAGGVAWGLAETHGGNCGFDSSHKMIVCTSATAGYVGDTGTTWGGVFVTNLSQQKIDDLLAKGIDVVGHDGDHSFRQAFEGTAGTGLQIGVEYLGIELYDLFAPDEYDWNPTCNSVEWDAGFENGRYECRT